MDKFLQNQHEYHTYIFLKAGSKLDIEINTNDFDKSIRYKGNVTEENRYLKDRILLKSKLEDSRFEIPGLSQNEFDTLIKNTLGQWKEKLLNLKLLKNYT